MKEYHDTNEKVKKGMNSIIIEMQRNESIHVQIKLIPKMVQRS